MPYEQPKFTIYIFGNPLLPFDNLPIKILPQLRKKFPQFNFVIFDPNENLKPQDKKLFIIDTVQGLKEVALIEDFDRIMTNKIYSLHDFDLGFNLKLLQKIGELEEIKIFGIPPELGVDEIVKQLTQILKQLH